MSNPIRIGHTYFPAKPQGIAKQPSSTSAAKPFQNWLQESLATPAANQARIQFSHHALQRLDDRGIRLTDEELSKLEDAVQKAAAKGSKESLIIMDQVAYVVNVANRKVITAVNQENMKEHVFTNIDSAVLI